MSWRTADVLLMARLSSLAYEVDPDRLAAGVNALDLGFIAVVSIPERTAVIAEWGDSVVLCFQGTRVTENTSLPEIWDDLDGDPLPGPWPGRVHAGFFRPILDLWPRICSVLPPGKPIVYTGHSLGGVSAHLAGTLLPGAVVSFGAPKGADDAYWNESYPPPAVPPLRIVHERDFAPDWPEFGPWRQPPGAMAWLHNGSVQRVNARTTWPDVSVCDHSIDAYVAALAALVEPIQEVAA